MSKQVLTTAAVAAVVVATADAQWSASGSLSGSGGRPNYNVGVSRTGASGWGGSATVGGQFGGKPTYGAGVSYTSPSATGWNMNGGVQKSPGSGFSGGISLTKRFEEEEYDEQRIGLPNPFPGGSTGPYNPTPPFRPFDEEEWEASAGVSGGNGRPQWNVGVSHKWEDEQDEQGLSLKKVKKSLNKIGKAAGKVSNAVEKGKDMGLLEEAEAEFEEQKFKLKKTLNKIGKAAGKVANAYGKAQAVGVLEEEEWEANAGISGGRGRPQWNVGVSHKWDEEELQSLRTDVLKIAKVIVEADEMGIFEEGAQVEQALKKFVKKAVKAAVVATEIGLLDEIMENESQSLKSTLKKVSKVAVAVDQAGLLEEGWEVDAGISGSGGKPTWNVGVKGSWEEEELDEQKFKLKKTLNKIGKAAGKVSNAVEKAQQIGVLEEEEWEANAGISGGRGRPQWNVGVSHKWEEETPVARRFAKRFFTSKQ